MPSALTDLRDIGPYVARVIQDDRTINQQVLVYNELWTPNEIYSALEKASGEKIPRNYESLEVLQERMAEGRKKMEAGATDFGTLLQVIGSQYLISWGIRGDNTPGYA